MVKNKKTIIFSDFDGTITERDVVVMIMEKFAPPEWEEIKNKILYERSITLKDGIEKLFGFIDSSKKAEIINFVKNKVRFRDGFVDFIDFCKTNEIEFNVLSGGLDFFIEEVLAQFKNKINIFCNKGDFTFGKIKIDYKYLPNNCSLCGNCGCCKVEIVEKYPRNDFTRVVIGDGLADLFPSKVADLVFARSDLINCLEQEKISYIEFKDFYEIKEKLIETMKK